MMISARCVGVILVAALVGCSGGTGYGSLGLVPVSGRVTLDGAPLAGVTVRFESPDLRIADGVTDANGKYTLMYDSLQPGCLPGAKVVRILPYVGEEPSPTEGPDGKLQPPPPSNIPTAYNEQSTLKAEVAAPGGSFDFALQSSP